MEYLNYLNIGFLLLYDLEVRLSNRALSLLIQLNTGFVILQYGLECPFWGSFSRKFPESGVGLAFASKNERGWLVWVWHWTTRACASKHGGCMTKLCFESLAWLGKKERDEFEMSLRCTTFPSFGKFLSRSGLSFLVRKRLWSRQHTRKGLFKST